MFDLIVVGKALPGLLSAAFLSQCGYKVLVVSDPGPYPCSPIFPFVGWASDDLWSYVWKRLGHIPNSSQVIRKKALDPAFTWVSTEHTLTFQHTFETQDVLLAHNSFLPDKFEQTLNTLKHLYREDQSFLIHTLWQQFNRGSLELAPSILNQMRHENLYTEKNKPPNTPLLKAVSNLLGLQKDTPLSAPLFYTLCHPKSLVAQGGSLSLVNWLFNIIKKFNGTILNNTHVTELLFDHSEAKGVVCDFPHGALSGGTLLINTSHENLRPIIPPPFCTGLNAHSRSFSVPDWVAHTTYFSEVDIDNLIKKQIHFPVLIASDRYKYNGSVINLSGRTYLLSNKPPPQELQPLLQSVGINKITKDLTQRLSFHNHGITEFKNIRYSMTLGSCENGIDSALLQGLSVTNWAKRQFARKTSARKAAFEHHRFNHQSTHSR